jgi:hypothetical protein
MNVQHTTLITYPPEGSCCLCWAIQNLLKLMGVRTLHLAIRTVNWGSDFCWVVNCVESSKSLEIALLMLVTLILVILRHFHSWELNFEHSEKLSINTASLFQQHTYMVVILVNNVNFCVGYILLDKITSM